MLFSDIEGSTALLSRLGDRYAETLDVQRRLLRSVWRRWRGIEMGTEGDSFYVVFELARDAVAAAVDAQRALTEQDWPGGEPVAVRMGLHTGEPVPHDGGYVGIDVHRAARVSAAAHGGQVVITAATSELVGDNLPDGTELTDLGWHRLKDFAAPLRLYQVNSDGLPRRFPPLKSLGTISSLPVDTTPLLGRRGVLQDLQDLLDRPVRLLTLTGTGGSGKTRLATALAASRAEFFPDGVFFVPLAGVTTKDNMWAAIVEGLDAGDECRDRDRFLSSLEHRHLLAVIDNVEQIPDAADVVDELLMSAPDVTVVATSRRPLHVRGEHEFPVWPLELPWSDDLAEAAASPAVQLFCQHAEMVRPGFELTAENARDIVALCRRLDGLPLALELAGARSKLLSPAGLLARLDSSMDLGGPAAGRPARQQSLRDTIAWSYDLLTADQRVVFRRLGVFAGGADLEAVAEVAQLDERYDPLDTVAALVDLSMVGTTEDSSGDLRIALLQTVSDFAHDQLVSEGELDEVRARHAAHFVKVVERHAPDIWTSRGLAARQQLQIEADNVRAALTWLLEPRPDGIPQEQATLALRMCVGQHVVWIHHGFLPESRGWFERALAADSGVDSPQRAAALICLAELSDGSVEASSARQWVDEALEMYTRLGDSGGVCDAYRELGFRHMRAGNYAEARDFVDRAVVIAREIDDPLRLAYSIHRRGWLELEQGEYLRAIAFFQESQTLARRRGDETSVVYVDVWIAECLVGAGRLDEAAHLLAEIADDVMRVSHQSLSFSILSAYAHLLSKRGEGVRAATILGAHWAHYALTGAEIELESEELWLRRTGLAAIRDELGELRWDELLADGSELTLKEALTYAQESGRVASDVG